MVELHEKGGNLIFSLTARPRSSRSTIAGIHGGALKVTLTSAPVDDAANEECRTLLSRLFDVPRSRITIIGGRTSRNKRIMIEGLTAATATAIFKQLQP